MYMNHSEKEINKVSQLFPLNEWVCETNNNSTLSFHKKLYSHVFYRVAIVNNGYRVTIPLGTTLYSTTLEKSPCDYIAMHKNMTKTF